MFQFYRSRQRRRTQLRRQARLDTDPPPAHSSPQQYRSPDHQRRESAPRRRVGSDIGGGWRQDDSPETSLELIDAFSPDIQGC